MNKTLKIFAIIAMTMVMLCTSTQMAFADNTPETAFDVVNGISPDMTQTSAASGLSTMAGRILGLIQIASAVAAVILVAVFGFKFILGSANEKADYQKSFVPLIVGVVVVFAATSIAKLIFGIVVV